MYIELTAVLVAVQEMREEGGEIFHNLEHNICVLSSGNVLPSHLTCFSSAVATRFSKVAKASIFLKFPARLPVSSYLEWSVLNI